MCAYPADNFIICFYLFILMENNMHAELRIPVILVCLNICLSELDI